MDKKLTKFLEELEFGELQKLENMAVYSLFCKESSQVSYLTLTEALDQKSLVITEVDEYGSVPNLKVTNNCINPVLLLDGEELVGAKQNRIINTTILVKEQSTLIIPVSCTEAGRWSYSKRTFDDSGVVMPRNIRREKSRAVTQNLNEFKSFNSDQSEVWREIDDLHKKVGTKSSTRAMKDAFEKTKERLNNFVNYFKPQKRQNGFMVFINGEPVGLEYVSSEKAFNTVFAKLIKSYAMEAVFAKQDKKARPTIKKAKDFINEATKCNQSKHKSIGYGWDNRFESPTIAGSALTHEDEIIHMVLFRISDEDSRKNPKDDELERWIASGNIRRRNRRDSFSNSNRREGANGLEIYDEGEIRDNKPDDVLENSNDSSHGNIDLDPYYRDSGIGIYD